MASNPTRAIRLAATAVLVAFVGYLCWEFAFNMPSSFAAVMSEFWGRAMLVDLYIGVAIFAAWVIYREAALLPRVLWPIAFLFLGNVATLLYVLIALRSATGPGGMNQFFHGRRTT